MDVCHGELHWYVLVHTIVLVWGFQTLLCDYEGG